MSIFWDYVRTAINGIWNLWNQASFAGVSVASLWFLGVIILIVEIVFNLGGED